MAQFNQASGNIVCDILTVCEKLNVGGPIIPKGRMSVVEIAGGLTVNGDINVTGSNVPTGPASGDLFGNYPNPDVVGINGTPITDDAPEIGYVLTYSKFDVATFNGTISDTMVLADTLTIDSVPVIIGGSFEIGMQLEHPGITGTVRIVSLNSGVLGAVGSVYTIDPIGSVGLTPSSLTGIMGSFRVWKPTTSGGGPPTGPAGAGGGALDGTYPDPIIKNSGVTMGTYGAANKSAQIKIEEDGRISLATEIALDAIAPGDIIPTAPGVIDLAGTYSAPKVIGLQNTPISTDSPTTPGQVLTFTGAGQWGPRPPGTGTFDAVSPSTISTGITGTYPAISLTVISGVAGVYGQPLSGILRIPQITVNDKGRIVVAADVLPFGAGPHTTGDVPVWNNTSKLWVPGPVPSSTSSASGDLTGTYPGPITVTRLNGIPISTTVAPMNELFLKYNMSSNEWVPGFGTAPTGTASGDLGGSYDGGGPIVEGLQGRPVAATAPTSGQVLKWNGSSWTPSVDAGGGAASGDLTGTYPGPITVDGIRGVPVTGASASPSTGEILVLTGGQWNAQSANAALYSATTNSDWNGAAPTTIGAALDRCAALLKTLNGGTGP